MLHPCRELCARAQWPRSEHITREFWDGSWPEVWAWPLLLGDVGEVERLRTRVGADETRAALADALSSERRCRQAYCTHDAELDLSRPPDGYDSVVGEVGDHLNYDELVVYNEAAALPEFLIVVSSDP